jgi:hypothetical protein
MSTAMEPIPEHDSKQASQAEPTAEDIKDWDEDKMLEWIKEKRGKVLNNDKLEKLKNAEITGEVFLNYAGDENSFQSQCKLPLSISVMLANLSRPYVGWKTAGIKSKFTIFIHAHYVDCKLTTSQETYSRPKMWR